MKEATELTIPSNGTGESITSTTPSELLKLAVSQGTNVDQLEKLMALQERWEANEARKAFEIAMAAFKAECSPIIKDKINKQYDSKYVSLENLVATVTPFLSKHDLSADWEIDQSAAGSGIKVTCIVTHKFGHFKSTSMVVPPDDSGAKNAIQKIKSAITYGKTCTYESRLGLASKVANLSDDGNGTGMSNGWIAERIEWFENARDQSELKRLFQDASTIALDAKDMNAYTALKTAKEKRKAEL